LPVVFGILVGCGVNVLARQKRLNKQLSIQNTRLQRDILITTMISEFLHEIRNPVHNLTAVLEDNQQGFTETQREIIRRNLGRFEEITSQYKKWNSLFDTIDPRQTVDFRRWLANFIDDKIQDRLQKLGIHYRQELGSFKIHMHPVLLDQAFITLFENAFAALTDVPAEKSITLSAKTAHFDGSTLAELKMINNGRLFPEEVLKHQGHSPVTSRAGTGFGLLLLRKMVDQVHGQLSLANDDGKAVVTLLIPCEAP
ncbi:MAG: ATP-binding protein, partial [Candidatus Omnitrophota bacterium]